MAITLDLDWFAFDLSDGQRLMLDVNWGEGGLGRAEAVLAVYDGSGALIQQSYSDGGGWLGAVPALGDDAVWLDIPDDENFVAEFTWTDEGDGALGLDYVPIAATGTGQGDVVADIAADDDSGLFAGGDVLYGGGIPMGDVLIGSEGNDTYRITAESEGETVTILDFHPGAGGDVLDISDLLAVASGTLDVSYDSHTLSTTLTVSGGIGDTVIVVQGVDLTSDFDTYVITDTIL